MSENHDPEQSLQSSGSEAEDGNQGVENAVNVSESSAENVSEMSDRLILTEPNQGTMFPQNNDVVGGEENSGRDGANNTLVVEDAGKEDMFVDCPDELNADGREVITTAEIEGSLREEKSSHVQETESDVQEMQNEVEKETLKHEVKSLRANLERTVSEKESYMHELEEGREAFVKELLSFHYQLKTVTDQQSSLNANERLHLQEIEHAEENTLVTNTTLKDLVNECSQLINRTLDERLHYETTIGELRKNLLLKDQEIENLNAKVVEFSVSDDAVRSYMDSIGNSTKVLSEKEGNIEVALDRVLASLHSVLNQQDFLDDSVSLNSVLNQQDFLDDSISKKTIHVERGTSLLINNYNKILLEINQLQGCLSGAKAGIVFPEYGTIFAAARDELIELKAKEVASIEKICHLEDENRRLADQLDNYKMTVETELEKTMKELEQERMRCGNTKEKLTIAVTKGKALVQQRDALKQSLADKISELEKYSIELQEKSNALEAAELSKVDLAKSENLVASLQENLLQRNIILESFEDILSQLEVPHELQSMDSMERLKWLVDEKKVLEAISLEFHKLKNTSFLADFPDFVSPYDLKFSFSWLKESFFQSKDELKVLRDELMFLQDELVTSQDDLSKTKEAAHGEINRISELLIIQLQEKDYVQDDLDDLTSKYQGVVVKEHQALLEKDQILKMLTEESGITTDDGGAYETSLDCNLLVNRCFQKIKEQNCSSVDISGDYMQSFEKVQSLLYVSHLDLMLCGIILEEEFSKMSNCSRRLGAMSQELSDVKGENSSLQRDLERSEEKYAMLREKLSLAVKKGKGLVQDRENMKNRLDEKNSEIEKLRLELHGLESTIADCRNQINLLSTDTERIPQLESDLGTMKDKCNQYEQFLSESNIMLQRVIESIDGIVLPVDIVFEEPIAKVKWLAEYIRECHDAKIHSEQELVNVKEEASTMASKLEDALAAMKSLEDALSSAENNIFQLTEKIREIESSKTHTEQELQKALDEAYTHSSKFVEASLSRNSLEESLSLAKNEISILVKEKEEAQVSKITAEMESNKVREEVSVQTDKLAEAHRTIESLEKTLTELETNVALLAEQNTEAQTVIGKLETEQKILQEEASSQESKLVDAFATTKSLEDALFEAESKISVFEGERRNFENEIAALNSRLNACSEELAGSNGSLQIKSVEFAGYVNDLHTFITDETLLTVMTGCFEKKFESLKQMDIILKNIGNCFVNSGLIDSHGHHSIEDPYVIKPLSHGNVITVERGNSEEIAADHVDNISSSFRKAMEGLCLKHKMFTYHFKGFSSSMDGCIDDLLRKVEATREDANFVCGHIESLKERVKNLEMYKQEQENTTAMLEDDVSTLVSACVDTTKELQFEVTNHLLSFSSNPELENLQDNISLESSETSGDSAAEHHARSGSKISAKAVEPLLSASRKVCSLVKHFESTRKVAAATIQDMQNRLEITEATSEKVREERDLKQNMIVKLETDLQVLQSSCDELRLQLETCQANVENLKERETEVSSSYNNLLVKQQEAGESILSAMQMETLFEKIRRIEIPLPESEILDLELYDSPDVKKLFYLTDYVSELQNQLNLLSHDKQKLQSTITTQILDIEHLKEEIDRDSRDKLDSEEMKKDLSELSFDLEQILSLFGCSDYNGDLKSDGLKGLVRILAKQVQNMISESENAKSNFEELNKKLLGSQKVVNELTTNSEEMKKDLSELSFSLEQILGLLGCSHYNGDLKSDGLKGLVRILAKQVQNMLSESENAKSNFEELNKKLLGSQKVVNELTTKNKLLEESLQGQTSQPEIMKKPEIIKERSIFEVSSLPSGSEISEIEDVGSVGITAIPSVPSASAAHARTLRKGSTEHLAINVETESDRLIGNVMDIDEDKGHAFKSLNTSGLIPRQGRHIADRIDGIWVSGGRILMSRPGARLGFITYWLLLHIWLLGTIL